MTFYQLITAAVADLEEHGYDDPERLAKWIMSIREELARITPTDAKIRSQVFDEMRGIYERLVERQSLLNRHPGVPMFTIERIKPKLRVQFYRSVEAAVSLIKLNREKAVEQTVQRFAGWATSIPAGGSDVVDKRETKTDLRKALAQLPFEERRVAIDQGHKLTAAIHDIVAEGGNAIAGEWQSMYRQRGYNYRVDHKERDGKVYAIRGSWAIEKGLMNKGAGYTDEMTRVAEEPFCRCKMRYMYSLRDLPADMLTQKGADELDRVRALLKTRAA